MGLALRIIGVARHPAHLGRPVGQAIELALVIQHHRQPGRQLSPPALVPEVLGDPQSLRRPSRAVVQFPTLMS